ncbi:hypothetical protein ACLOJK_037090 [Asimina triloba]
MSRPDDGARSYGRQKLTQTFVATGPELAHTAARLHGSNSAGTSSDGAGRDARNGTRSDNLMRQAARKKDAGVQHENFLGALRHYIARRQDSGPAGCPSGTAATHNEGPVAPFPTTCCGSHPDDGARSYERRKLTRTFVATGPELAHTAARLRDSDFAGPSRDGAGRDGRNGTRSNNPMGQTTKKRMQGCNTRSSQEPSGGAIAHDKGPVAPFPTTCCTSRPDDGARSYGRRKLTRTFVATGPELAHTAARLRSSDFAGPSRDAAGRDARNGTRAGMIAPVRLALDEGPIAHRPDDGARSYGRRKLTQTFVATGPELAHTAARLRDGARCGGAGHDARNGTRSDNPMGQAAKRKDAGVQHEDFPVGHPS